MRKFALCLASLIAMAAFVVAVPAAQATTSAYPVLPFSIKNGNTYTIGTATFLNRSVRIAGEQKSVNGSGCRRTEATAYTYPGAELGWGQSPTICQRSAKFSFDVPANIRGSAPRVLIEFIYVDAANETWYTLDFQDLIR